MDSLRGKLLVASPALNDPNFERSVVLIGEHNEDGALGLVLNHPSDTSVSEALPELTRLTDGDAIVFAGGPVGRNVVVVLARFDEVGEVDDEVPGRHTIAGSTIGVVADIDELERLGDAAVETRVFAGYAGWGPGQLDEEVGRSDWIVNDPAEDDVFTDSPRELWGAVLTRMGGSYALLARMPRDPSVN